MVICAISYRLCTEGVIMKGSEIQSDEDLLQFVQERCIDTILFEVFKSNYFRFLEACGDLSREVSITEGHTEIRRSDGTLYNLPTVEVTFMMADDFNPGYRFMFGEGKEEGKIIRIVGRKSDEPFSRSPPVQIH
jgi:hypothetical protein